MALKDLEIRALKSRERIYKKADERGLYIEVHPTGSKLWRFKFTFLGKDKRIAFGRYPEVGLAEARKKRDEARQSFVRETIRCSSGSGKNCWQHTARRTPSTK
jgi:hypothetical protein